MIRDCSSCFVELQTMEARRPARPRQESTRVMMVTWTIIPHRLGVSDGGADGARSRLGGKEAGRARGVKVQTGWHRV